MIEVNKIICGDSLIVLKELPENSVDSIVTDPPYGLEFMGKEWDKFEPKRLTQRWAGKERRLIGDGSGKGGNFGERFNEMPKSIPKKNKKCKICGHYFYSGTPCKCENPEWEIDNSYVNNYQQFVFQWATECFRVLKPGGYLLSFGGTRTYHRMACAIEDAGFEIRDCIMWIYGSGFPKSLNIGKQIDKLQGNERKVLGIKKGQGNIPNDRGNWGLKPNEDVIIDKGNSEWEGWGTALKPACEPIVVARKPLSEKNVALNVLKWGTGGINLNESRIPSGMEHFRGIVGKKITESDWKNKSGFGKEFKASDNPLGRFPANLILDEESAKMLDEQSGISKSSGGRIGKKDKSIIDFGLSGKYQKGNPGFGDVGGASRFFYVAKASRTERDKGLENIEAKRIEGRDMGQDERDVPYKNRPAPQYNQHPTVKPIKLMEYLVKLITPPKGIVLDPFIGSGTTAIACIKTSRNFIGIEKEPKYIEIANARIKSYLEQTKLEADKNDRRINHALDGM